MKERYKKLFTLYAVMFKIGCFTFGGGWSIIAQIEAEFSKKRGWVSEKQILDFMSIAKSLPGIMIVNYAVLFGYTVSGVPGALAAAFGLVSPAVIVITVVTNFYDFFATNPYVIKIMNGVRSAVIPVIIAAAWKLKNSALIDKMTCLICGVVAMICIFCDLNKLLIVIGCGVFGLIWMKGGRKGDTDIS